MKVQILDQLLECENKPEALEGLFSAINNTLENPEYVFFCMDIDKVKVYKDHYEYIMKRLPKVNCIKVELFIIKDEAAKLILTASNYLERALPEIEQLVDAFYLGAEDNDSIDKLGQLFEGLQWIITAVEGLEAGKDKYQSISSSEAWNQCVSDTAAIKDTLFSFKEAIANMDKILIADILKYEIADILAVLNVKLKKILGSNE